MSITTELPQVTTWHENSLPARFQRKDAAIRTLRTAATSNKTTSTIGIRNKASSSQNTVDILDSVIATNQSKELPLSSPRRSLSSQPPTILEQSASLPLIERFHYLLTHTSQLIQTNGPYSTTHSGTLLCFSNPKTKLSPTRFTLSLAAAQDAHHHTQPHGPISTDLTIFTALWSTTIALLDIILNSHALTLEDFGWGMYGLVAGAMYPASSDELFQSHKQRLHAALLSLPSLNRKPGERAPGAVKTTPAGRVHTLSTANRSVHICATMLVQGMRRDGWRVLRWGHGVKVVEAWVKTLGKELESLVTAMEGGVGEEEIVYESEDEGLQMPKMKRPEIVRSVSYG
ncbi:hypothetical protein B0J11DRAFT_576001 [Dendryphion nanum]|uniref:Uncharacterized protein n=1 Tax=Dendryphion nanum TaxID=256645 RepID=A0A9P9ECK8_9PLEO|nr:hypothetical protein B0J11DRAFT_576001 [Dendryphion nanum]